MRLNHFMLMIAYNFLNHGMDKKAINLFIDNYKFLSKQYIYVLLCLHSEHDYELWISNKLDAKLQKTRTINKIWDFYIQPDHLRVYHMIINKTKS